MVSCGILMPLLGGSQKGIFHVVSHVMRQGSAPIADDAGESYCFSRAILSRLEKLLCTIQVRAHNSWTPHTVDPNVRLVQGTGTAE